MSSSIVDYRAGSVRYLLPLLAAGALLGALSPAAAEQTTAVAQAEPAYHRIILGKDGMPEPAALEALASEVKRETAGAPAQLLVMVHGFQTPLDDGERDFQAIADRMRKEGTRIGLRTAIVGVHWDSGSADLAKWFPKAVGSRITSLLGFKKAVKNPYLEKAEEARRNGRTGLRAVLLGLQEAAPELPVHLLAHSMGAEMVVAALAPEACAGGKSGPEAPAIQRPEQVLRVGMVTLVGADLDYDYFCRDQETGLERALNRAQVWWITVPRDKRADGMLELRRGAGRCDAVGNRGLKLRKSDLNRLLARRGLVVDQGKVPTKHGFIEYLCEDRVRALAASMLYLQDPHAAAGRNSVLAALDGVLAADPTTLRASTSDDACLRLYTAWRTKSATSRYPAIAVADDTNGSSMEARGGIGTLAGMSQ
jgi:hypothetical protein